MQKKLLAVAVAGALAAPVAAMAQSSVTVSGAINVWYEQAGASGATNTTTPTSTASTFDVKSRDRMQDGAGSNIRFTAVEDIGGGMQGFIQVESAVINQANTRNDGVSNGQAVTTLQSAGGWATRNSGVGLRGQSWGEVLIGIWDVHYNEQDPVDSQRLRGSAHGTSLGLLNTFGMPGTATGTGSLGGVQIGGRYSNIIRYQSPNWAGFNFKLAYSRPTDGTVPTNVNTVVDGSKNKAINFAPQWSNGPIFVGYSYFKDSDIVTGQATMFSGAAVSNLAGGPALATPAAGGGLLVGSGATGAASAATNLTTITSSRLSGAYTFPFGLKLGLVYDQSKLNLKSSGATFSGSEFKRNVWALPISWNTGAHTIFATYAQASKLKGSVGLASGASVDVSSIGVTASGATAAQDVGSNSKAKFYMLGYYYDLSKRTN